jgi:hypothetical protein
MGGQVNTFSARIRDSEALDLALYAYPFPPKFYGLLPVGEGTAAVQLFGSLP